MQDRAESDAQKEQVIERLLAVWKQNPSLRLGQLIINVFPDPYYTEDEVLIDDIEFLYGKLQARKRLQ